VCASGGIIKGDVLTVDGKAYHPEHFKCHTCDKPINGSYSLRDGHGP
jgi:hypothetical protein